MREREGERERWEAAGMVAGRTGCCFTVTELPLTPHQVFSYAYIDPSLTTSLSPASPALTSTTTPTRRQIEAQAAHRKSPITAKFLSPQIVWLLTLSGSMTEAREVSPINNPKSLNNVLLIYDHS